MFKDKDLGFKKFISQMKAAVKSSTFRALVGIQGSKIERKDDEIDNVKIGFLNEFGFEHIPERSFLRSTLTRNGKKYQLMGIKLIKLHVGKNLNVKTILGKLGSQVSSDVRRTIQQSIPPPLSAMTLKRRAKKSKYLQGRKRKGKKITQEEISTNHIPLIDTGQLLGSIEYVVKDAKNIPRRTK